MKIGIVTVYNSNNYGSFLQASSLCRTFECKGHDVFFIETGARSTMKGIVVPYVRSMVKSLITLKIRKLKFQFTGFFSMISNLKSIKTIKPEKAEELDAIVFGSDEIWNATRAEMSENKIFFGNGIKCRIKISYATSMNNATSDDLLKIDVVDDLMKFRGISVRDKWSQDQLVSLGITKTQIVLDPTLLWPVSEDGNYKLTIEEPYIALYYFNPTSEEIQEIKRIADILSRKIVSIGYWYDWCDLCVTGRNPFLFYKKADFVITNTFHGTAFAINMGKQFVSVVKNKKKISELLESFQLINQMATEIAADSIVEKLCTEIDYQRVGLILDTRRRESQDYLVKTLV